MKQYIVGGLAAALIGGGLINSAHPASAGCLTKDGSLSAGAMAPSSLTAPGNVAWYLARLVAMSATAPTKPGI